MTGGRHMEAIGGGEESLGVAGDGQRARPHECRLLILHFR